MFNLQLYWKRDSWHRCFPVNFAKFLIIPLSQNTSKRLILQLLNLFFSTQNIIKKLVRKNLIIFCLLIVPEKTGWYFPHSVWIRRYTEQSPYSIQMRENVDQKKLRIRILCTQWYLHRFIEAFQISILKKILSKKLMFS